MNQKERKTNALAKNKDGITLPVAETATRMPDDYGRFITDLKTRIRQERIKTVLAANASMVLLYWDIGSAILAKQTSEGWGAKVIDRMSHDLKEEFPEMNGFSARNLKYMRKFAESWPDSKIVQRTVAQIPWRSNIALMDKLDNAQTRLWYAQKTIENGWSRNVLVIQIESGLHNRTGQSANNFDVSLPPANSDMANQIFKDPYIFDFLGTADVRREKELENKLIEHLEKFLLELGQGFAFVGRQVHLEFRDQDYYIDLLFYHLKLRCFVVVELKSGKFDPGHVGKLNMYMNIVDDLMRHTDDNKTIGLLLVKEKNHTLAKYALSGYTNPIGVAEWEKQITDSLPDDLKPSLPTIEEIEAELEKKIGNND
ncbi:MAG: PDDEXK nuclease domain-containing protein [Thermodesulfobacteriota bacterium]|nr:PDDEXK nuclease domain-containing protein [Thermodesulfobacteriota bacterium]